MPTKRVNDMVPKRSIRDISKKDILPPKRVLPRATKVSKAAVIKPHAAEIDSIIGGPKVSDKVKPYSVETRFANAPIKLSVTNNKYRKLIYPVIIFFVLIIIGAIFLTYNSKATINIKPKTVSIPVDMIFTAKKTPTATIEIPYEVVNLSETASSTVNGVEGSFIQNKSKGVVTLYNNNPAPGQNLANGTRIENSKGLVYRLSKAVVIPGKKTVAGKSVPGSIDVVVIADQPGDVYNSKVLDLTGDFKIVGFKGTPKFTTVYGRQKTDLTGGYVGRDWKIDPEIASSTTASLKNNIFTNLSSEYSKNIPADYVTFPGNILVTYSNPEYVPRGNGKVDIKITGNLSGAIIGKKSIASLVLSRQQNKYSLDIFNPENIQDLTYTPITKNFSAKNEQNLIFKLSGNMVLNGIVVDKDISAKLIGKSTDESKSIFANYPSIASADVIITPFWVNSFPNKTERLRINVVK